MNNTKSGSISFTGIMIRIVVSLLLVLLTYNPGGYSYFHWVLADLGAFDALKGFVGAVLLVAWVVFVRTALVSLGSLGVILSALVLGTLVWMLYDFGLLSTTRSSAFVWIILVVTGIILGIGLSWSLIRQRATGQVEVN
ncbi:MAG: hypothetical protein IPG20_21025 [Gammaproteobacteria bacterium]|jgi:hypothetical protein|nr:hypothetical protein [Gammaproteobacteria bacterium]